MDAYQNNKKLLISHIGKLEVKSNALFYNEKIDYDSMIDDAQEIIKILNFMKLHEKVNKEVKNKTEKE